MRWIELKSITGEPITVNAGSISYILPGGEAKNFSDYKAWSLQEYTSTHVYFGKYYVLCVESLEEIKNLVKRSINE
jgi:hypothetical protein